MSTTPESLILEHLRGLRGIMDAVRDDMREVKLRLTTLEQSVAAVASLQTSHYAGLSSRLDNHDKRLEHIERRLDLVEA